MSGFDVEDPAGAKVVGRTLAILVAFTRYGHTLGVTRLSAITGLPKSTVHRLATELVDAGFLVRAGRSYRIAPLAFEVGSAYIHCTDRGIVPLAGPHLATLFQDTDCTVGLYVHDESEGMLLMDQVVDARYPESAQSVGSRVALVGTAPSKVLAAFDAPGQEMTRATIDAREAQRISDSGLASDAGVLVPGQVTVAAAVLVGEVPVAAITASVPPTGADLEALGSAVRRAARLLASDFVTARRDLEDYGKESPLRDLLDEE